MGDGKKGVCVILSWENQLRDLLAHNMDISLDELRLIAYKYRASDEKQIQVARQQPLRSTKLTLKYQDLINNDPLLYLGNSFSILLRNCVSYLELRLHYKIFIRSHNKIRPI